MDELHRKHHDLIMKLNPRLPSNSSRSWPYLMYDDLRRAMPGEVFYLYKAEGRSHGPASLYTKVYNTKGFVVLWAYSFDNIRAADKKDLFRCQDSDCYEWVWHWCKKTEETYVKRWKKPSGNVAGAAVVTNAAFHYRDGSRHVRSCSKRDGT